MVLLSASSVLIVAILLLEGALCGRNHAFIGYTEKNKGGVAPPPKVDFKIKISSAYGQFVVKLLPDLAPDTCTLVWELAHKAVCSGCKFYRHEPVPMNWAVNGYYGPPYALLQGSLADMARVPPFENKAELPIKRGHIAMIPNCKEFFIATADHPEWGHSHTIWGEVESLDDEPNHPFEPYHSSTDNGGITTRWLNEGFPFNITLLHLLADDADVDGTEMTESALMVASTVLPATGPASTGVAITPTATEH